MKRARQSGFQMIPFGDRDIITRFFLGQLNSVPEEIDDRVRAETLLKRAALKAGKVQSGAQIQE